MNGTPDRLSIIGFKIKLKSPLRPNRQSHRCWPRAGRVRFNHANTFWAANPGLSQTNCTQLGRISKWPSVGCCAIKQHGTHGNPTGPL